MARANGSKTAQTEQTPSTATALEETAMTADEAEVEAKDEAEVEAESETKNETEAEVDTQAIDDSLTSLKALLTAVEKLQKVRQEVGDIKPLLLRMLEGEVVSGEELEQLKTGVGGLFKLVKAYSDHQTALTKAQPARNLLDQVLSISHANKSHD